MFIRFYHWNTNIADNALNLRPHVRRRQVYFAIRRAELTTVTLIFIQFSHHLNRCYYIGNRHAFPPRQTEANETDLK